MAQESAQRPRGAVCEHTYTESGGRRWICTLDAGHDGGHKAQFLDGKAYRTWPREPWQALTDNPPPVGEGAALIAATEQQIADALPADDATAAAESAAHAWRETARILARALDGSPAAPVQPEERRPQYERDAAKLAQPGWCREQVAELVVEASERGLRWKNYAVVPSVIAEIDRLRAALAEAEEEWKRQQARGDEWQMQSQKFAASRDEARRQARLMEVKAATEKALGDGSRRELDTLRADVQRIARSVDRFPSEAERWASELIEATEPNPAAPTSGGKS